MLRRSHPSAAAGSELPLKYSFPVGNPWQRRSAVWQGQVEQGKMLSDGVQYTLVKGDLERADLEATLLLSEPGVPENR